MKNVLITGGAGFIGSHTVDLLLHNNISVTVFDNLSSGRREYLPASHPLLRFIEADVLDFPAVKRAVSACDAVLHLAAMASVPKSLEDPVQSLLVNTQGCLHILQAIREVSHPVRFVYASSAAVYGNTLALPCAEAASRAALLSPYALQKAHDEDYADLYARLFSIPSLGLRYFNVYGLRQDPQSPYSGVISRFLKAYEQNAELTIFGDGQQSRDFISVHDVAQANYLALQRDGHGVLNIATGVPETLLSFVEYLQAAGGKPAQLCFLPARLGDIAQSYAAIERAKQVLGFSYTVSLKEGVSKLLKSL